ncbi:putative PEP-binding protein, partial [Salmonella enterica]|uniref:putative PEP-binding protein n=1 Tax=Salmonella enterica TaxID=28901 RepID=UPI0032993964
VKVIPEVMIPLVAHVKELARMKELLIRVAEETMKRYGKKVAYTIGTMIELPRAALVADDIAKEAEFFS